MSWALEEELQLSGIIIHNSVGGIRLCLEKSIIERFPYIPQPFAPSYEWVIHLTHMHAYLDKAFNPKVSV